MSYSMKQFFLSKCCPNILKLIPLCFLFHNSFQIHLLPHLSSIPITMWDLHHHLINLLLSLNLLPFLNPTHLHFPLHPIWIQLLIQLTLKSYSSENQPELNKNLHICRTIIVVMSLLLKMQLRHLLQLTVLPLKVIYILFTLFFLLVDCLHPIKLFSPLSQTLQNLNHTPKFLTSPNGKLPCNMNLLLWS